MSGASSEENKINPIGFNVKYTTLEAFYRMALRVVEP
jgi:hypothetical protein